MTEIDYQYECSRAELLGLPKPSREEFFSREREATKEETEEETEMTAEQAEDVSVKQEGFRRIGGGLDELNSILSSTQKKLNRFKVVCGSFSSLLKLQIASKTEDESEQSTDSNIANQNVGGLMEEINVPVTGSPHMQSGDSQLSKLDSLINKAERAELSLHSQNKQMRKFLN